MKSTGSVGTWLALLILGAVAIVAYRTNTTLAENPRWVGHTHEAIESVGDLSATLADAESERRGFALTGDPTISARFAAAVKQLHERQGKVRALTRDNPLQGRRMEQLEPLLVKRVALLEAATAERRTRGFDAEREAAATLEGNAVSAMVKTIVADIIAEEWGLLREREQRMDESITRAKIMLVTGTAVSFVLIVLALSGLRREVTRRTRSEAARRDSEELLSATLQSMGDGVISTDRDGRVVQMNPVAEALTGFSMELARGKPSAEVFRIVNEATREPAVDPVARALTEGIAVALADHTALLARNGTETPIADSAAPIRNNAGELAGAVLVFRDQTRERAAEAATHQATAFLDSIVQNIPHMIFVKDAEQLRFQRLNRAGEELLGLTSATIMGKGDRDFFPPDQAAAFEAKDRATLSRKVVIDIAEEPIQAKQGKRWLHTKKVPILDEAGKPRYLLGISEDITERKLAAEALEDAKEAAEAASRELEAFSYSVAHDLRAPLRTIDGFSQALLEDAEHQLDAENKVHLGRILRATARMAELIDDLLALSRVTRSELRRADVDLSAVARSVAAQLRTGQPERQTEILIQDGLLVQGDASLLHIALENLLGNAWKFTSKLVASKPGRIEVGATPRRDGAPEGVVEMFVRDDGAGFDMAHAAKLFGVFQRLHATNEFEGTGIGLATVHRIVMRHGGHIRAEAHVNGGATFFFTLDSREVST